MYVRSCSGKSNKRIMKRITTSIALAALLVMGLLSPALAAQKGKKVTITGEGMCAKCALHLTDKCQNVIQTKVDGKVVNYFLADNKLSKDFHENLCRENHKVTATGTLTKKDGKEILTVTKIALVKEK